MRTTRQMNHLLKQRIITEELLAACIFSCNKRAKNYRDLVWRYRDVSDVIWIQSGLRKLRFYSYKDTFLSLVAPVEIHVETIDTRRGRKDKYYFFYVLGNHSFHQPIDDDEFDPDYDCPELPVRVLTDFHTTGMDIRDLVSVQFCTKLRELIKSKDFTYLPMETNKGGD